MNIDDIRPYQEYEKMQKRLTITRSFEVKELDEIVAEYNASTDRDLNALIARVWNKAYTLGCIDGAHED